MGKAVTLGGDSQAQACAIEQLQRTIRGAIRMARLYAAGSTEPPIQFAEAIEDLANELMDISDDIAARARSELSPSR